MVKGLKFKIDFSAGTKVPIKTKKAIKTANIVSKNKVIEPARYDRGLLPLFAKSKKTKSRVWIESPPIKLPIITGMCPWIAALVTTAISGRLPVIPKRIKPPKASPILKRVSRESVVLVRFIPAIHVITAEAIKPERSKIKGALPIY
jgi:hypothetical protein